MGCKWIYRNQLTKNMTPLDSATSASVDPRSPMAPPYVDENPNLALVEAGLDAAENETRDAVADEYEAAARLSDDPDEHLDDIDFTAAEDSSTSTELAAMHEEFIPYGEAEE